MTDEAAAPPPPPAEEKKVPTPPNPENVARKRLDDATEELQRAAAGTPAAMQMPWDVHVAQFDTLMVTLAEQGIIDKAAYWNNCADRFLEIASNYRKAALAGGGLIQQATGRKN